MWNGIDLARLSDIETRCASFENPRGERGAGGTAASNLGPGRKGSPWKSLEPGEEVELCVAEGSGQIRHIWLTCTLDPQRLRGLVLRAWWDGMQNPSVECPVGDFFGCAHGRTPHFVNAMQSMQEGAGLNAYFPMPFSNGCRITLTNESPEPTEMVFYYVDYTLGDTVTPDMGRFHTAFRRENPTTLKRDFQILPPRHGRGRFLGSTIGARILDPEWWGEGEFKAYLDGDTTLPTICGTGVEDYACSAWGIGQHFALYAGCPFIASVPPRYNLVSFYRFHVVDPLYFHTDIRVEMQQMGLGFDENGEGILAERQDDWSAAAFWYQDGNEPLAPMPNYEARVAGLDLVEGEPEFKREGR